MTTLDTERLERQLGAILDASILDPADFKFLTSSSNRQVKRCYHPRQECNNNDDGDEQLFLQRSDLPPISIFDPRFRLTESVPGEADGVNALSILTPPSLPEALTIAADATAPEMHTTNTPLVSSDFTHRDAALRGDLTDTSLVQIMSSRPSLRKNSNPSDRLSHLSRILIQRHWKSALVVLLLTAINVIIVLALQESSRGGGELPEDKRPIPSANRAQSTLDMIKSRGYLLCGVVEYPGLSKQDVSTGDWGGFEIDLCRAVGAAIFGADGQVTFTNTTYAERFRILHSGQVDLLAAGATYTMERDIYEPTVKAGFSFSVPYIYDGVSYAGKPQYVDCADQKIATGICSGLRICVHDNTSHVQVIEDLFPDTSLIVLAPTRASFYSLFVNEHCNVLAGQQFDLAQSNVQQAGYSGGYVFSSNLYSNEPLALVTRKNDPEWSDFVNWVFLALLTAEKKQITQQIAQDSIRNPGPVVDKSQFPFYHAVATVGNYGEMYARYLELIVPRAQINQQNNGSTPLIYSFPFGNTNTLGEGPSVNGTLARIRDRGYLLCGTSESLFFANYNRNTHAWEGYDVDYCRAVAAAIFDGMELVMYLPLTGVNRWESLANGAIDLISWDTTWNYERDLYEPSTKQGFTFSQPTLYTGVQFGGIPPYGDCAENLNIHGNCDALKICVKSATTTLEKLRNLFLNAIIVTRASDEKVVDCLTQNEGNAIAADGYITANFTLKAQGYSGLYQTSPTLFSRENLAMVTRQDDPQWSSFVNWVVMATFYAEEQSITQANFTYMPSTNIFGSNFTNMFRNAIQSVGSHYEILSRHTIGKYDIDNINRLNANPYGPQHYPPAGLFGLF